MHIKIGCVVWLALGWGAQLAAQEVPQQAPAHADFERLKSLEGTWSLQGEEPGSVTYHNTAAGSAVVETLFPGEPHEMVTIYHLDGDKITLTHYCAMGNQPRMSQVEAPEAGCIAFDFSGGTGVDGVAHMHALTVTFIDKDAIRQEWLAVDAEGAALEKAVFEWKRVSE